MEGMEQAIQQVLSDPQMMEKIMGMAQMLGGGPPQENTSGESSEDGPKMPDMDLSGLQQLTGLLGQANIDGDQQNLLKALTPYMSSPRIQKLRRAMQAARLAELASTMLSKGGEASV